VGQERLGPSYFFISLVLGPLNSLMMMIFYLFLQKQQIGYCYIPIWVYLMLRFFLKVYMEFGSYFLFLQEQIKDIIMPIHADKVR
jgi:hypothetical protein